MTEHLETMPCPETAPCPDWVDAEPFRAHVRDLICETGLSWRLVAAHAGVAPRAVRSLLHGRRGYTLHRLHVSIARALTTTSIESIAADQHLVTDATDDPAADRRPPHRRPRPQPGPPPAARRPRPARRPPGLALQPRHRRPRHRLLRPPHHQPAHGHQPDRPRPRRPRRTPAPACRVRSTNAIGQKADLGRMDYRFLISHHRGQERMLIQAQVWAPEWVSGPAPDDDEQPVRRDWFTADQWTVTEAPTKLTEAALRDICAARGWTLLGDITTEEDGTIVVPVEPADWEQVLASHRPPPQPDAAGLGSKPRPPGWASSPASPAAKATTATSAPSRSPRWATSAASASTRSKTKSTTPKRSGAPWPPHDGAANRPSPSRPKTPGLATSHHGAVAGPRRGRRRSTEAEGRSAPSR